MLQVLQDVKSGETRLDTVPPPALLPGMVKVRTAASLISAGTERMIIDLAQKSYVGKAQARPDLVKQVLAKAKKEGWLNTWRNVQSKLEKPLPLGYSAAGIVEAVGAGVEGVQVGDRVAVAGAGYANHAEVCVVPKNLVALIPEGVSYEAASYSTVAAIALQGVRLARPELGDNVAVLGLGLIGLITVQLLKANGCRVIGIDLDPDKVQLALDLGADAAVTEDVERTVEQFTRGYGADHTLVTAATKSNGPIEQAGTITRRRGQVVVVGAVGMNVPRDAYYKKELELKISMSYGPGRYDPSYEEGGIDYPYDYVRWTEQRNLEAVLGLMAEDKLQVRRLTTHRFAIDRALDAYGLIGKGSEPYVGIVLEYDVDRAQEGVVRLDAPSEAHTVSTVMDVGFVGAGNYAALHLLPHVQKAEGVRLAGLVTATGPSAVQKAEKFGFRFATTEYEELLQDADLDTVFIATRHSTHADFAARALDAGKHVFVGKPVVVTEEQLDDVIAAYEGANSKRPTALMVGLNRRFAPHVVVLKAALRPGPKQMIYRVNSGHIPTSSWLHAPEEGGGMLVGEMCHFLDLMQFVAGEKPVRVYAQALTLGRGDVADHDNLTITVTFDGGSVGTLAYSTVGDKAASKERLEVYGAGVAAALDDFRRLDIVSDGDRQKQKAANQDKGQAVMVAETLQAIRLTGQAPIPFEDLVLGMRMVFAARQSVAAGAPAEVAFSATPVTN